MFTPDNDWLKMRKDGSVLLIVFLLLFSFIIIIQFLYTIAQGKHRAMLCISKSFKTEQHQQQNKMNTNI